MSWVYLFNKVGLINRLSDDGRFILNTKKPSNHTIHKEK
ncbi:hypothetical protein AO369_0408 [Moraxella catarrhalis]|nr:hypothetical protein AO369_0408 [Moraxella catarrhalis]